jgi:hypothetical protein
VEKLHVDTHEFAPFKSLLRGLLRVPAMFEQRETSPAPAFWCPRPCTQTSVQSAWSVSHSRTPARGPTPRLCATSAEIKPLKAAKCPFVNLPEKDAGRWRQGLTAEKMKECVWVEPKDRMFAPNIK